MIGFRLALILAPWGHLCLLVNPWPSRHLALQALSGWRNLESGLTFFWILKKNVFLGVTCINSITDIELIATWYHILYIYYVRNIKHTYSYISIYEFIYNIKCINLVNSYITPYVACIWGDIGNGHSMVKRDLIVGKREKEYTGAFARVQSRKRNRLVMAGFREVVITENSKRKP